MRHVQESLVKLSAHYPEAGHNVSTMRVLAADYFDAFKDWSVETYNSALRMARKKCRFFPKIADIEAASNEACELARIQHEEEAARNKEVLFIEEYGSYNDEEMIARNKKALSVMGKVAGGEISMEEADRQLEEIRRTMN